MLGAHNAIDMPQSTEYAKEMRKWEATHTRFGPPGRQYAFQAFPKMVFKAARVDGKGIQIVDTHIVGNELEERNLQSRGFCVTQEAAIAAIEAEQTLHGTLAAEREYAIRHGRLSNPAIAEVRAAEEAHGATHLPDVPMKPRRGRPAKKTVTVE